MSALIIHYFLFYNCASYHSSINWRFAVYKMKSNDKSREAKYHIVKDIMKHKLKDAMNCIKAARTELNRSKAILDKVVRKGTIVRHEFMEIVDIEVKDIWKETKKKNEEKIVWNIHKHKKVQADNEYRN